MSERPSFFAALPGEPGPRDNHGDEQTQPVIRRHAAHSDYRRALEGLQENLARFHMYNEDQALRGWIANAKRARTHLDEALQELERQVTEFIDTAYREVDAPVGLAGVVAADKLERWPGETPEEHELRLFKDYGIRIPEKADPVDTDFPVDTAFFLPKPPDQTLEHLTHIRDLLSQLVANQARPAVNLTNISQTLADDPAKLWESLKGVDKETLRKKLFGEIAEGSEHLDVRGPQSIGHPSELDQRIGQNRNLLDEAVDDLLRRRGLSGHPLAQRFSRLLDDTVEIFANLVRESHDETSPSVDGCGDPTVGDGPVAEVSEESSATAGTDTTIGVDTSPLVVHRLASLQDAEADYRKLEYDLAEAAHRVKSCALDLESARSDEVSPRSPGDSSGKFSNRRRPGARFSHPAPPAAPETPDAAQ